MSVDLVRSDVLAIAFTVADSHQGGSDVEAANLPSRDVRGLDWAKVNEKDQFEQERVHVFYSSLGTLANSEGLSYAMFNTTVQVWLGNTLFQSSKGDFHVGEAPWNDLVFAGPESHHLVEGTTLRPLAGVPIQVKPGENARTDLGNGVSVVCSVDYREKTESFRDRPDTNLLSYALGVSVVLGSMFYLGSLVPDQVLALGEFSTETEPAYARYFFQADEKPEIHEADQVVVEKGLGARSRGEEGSVGNPKSPTKGGGSLKVMGAAKIPQLSRTFNPDQAARSAGILGILASQEGHFLASMDGGAFTVGQDDQDIWGSLTGAGESFGGGGLGLIGSGRMGGGSAQGLVGIGNTGLIAKSPIAKQTVGFGPKTKKNPTIETVGKVESSGLDRDVVRRIVRSRINEVRSCYNAGLTKNPSLEGRVVVQFTVLSVGKVSASLVAENTTKDDSLGNCVAKAVKRWTFPASKGTSIVSYPFRLSV